MSVIETERQDVLPAAYAPFLPVLERLSEPLVRVLEGQLVQFERLVRSMDTREFVPQGEFEGLGGLTMRGEVTHILQSELLLRTEAPLEFLRRLAESETVYLEKQYADPGARSVYRATISAGPGMLGHGRIVALAAIFFLARVARERGAEFHWCVLPRADGPVWFDEVSVNTIKRFLRAAAWREMHADDLGEAGKVWTSLEPQALKDENFRAVDWVIGADPRRPALRGAPALAVRDSANSLSFALLPQIPGEPRSAQLLVRQNGRERARAAILFPDDHSCVSALENPFRPMKPQQRGGSALGTSIPALPGWEPHYFIMPNPQTHVVRLDEGLLILRWAGKDGFAQRHFVPIPEGVHLVGVRMQDNMFSVMVHEVRGGREMLSYGQFLLLGGASTKPVLARSRQVPSKHLFDKRGRYAVPPINIGEGAEFYSSSGAAYHLSFHHAQYDVGFMPLYKAPRTIFANPPYRVVEAEDGGRKTLRVLKQRHGLVDDYPAGDLPEQLYGMVYSGGDRSLAYSAAPGVWTIPAAVKPGDQDRPRQIVVAPHETLLIGRISGTGETARIWSDARYGGDGSIRSVRQEEGAMVLRQAQLRLGGDAMSIVKIALADDGYWALAADADGAPSELLHYRLRKRDSRYLCDRFPLDGLRAKAAKIDLETLHD
jgi:hypothetical protein